MVANGLKLYLIAFLASFASIPSFCQNQGKDAVIVEFVHSVYDPLMEFFPNAFLEIPGLDDRILATTDSLIKAHFEVSEVERGSEIVVQRTYVNALGRPEALRKADRTHGDIFIAIESDIFPGPNSLYKFMLQIWAEDKAGNELFDGKTKILFSAAATSKEREIQGYTVLSPDDFGQLYTDALMGAFHKKKKLSQRAYERPSDPFLTRFAAEANKCYLVTKKKNHYNYLLQDSLQNSLGAVAVEEQAAIDKKLGNFLNYLVEKSAARKAARFHLQNDLLQTQYVVDIWGKGYDDGDLDVKITFLQDEKTIGELNYQHCSLEGTLHENRYIIECDYQVMKFHQEGIGMVALVRHDHQQAYFSTMMTQEAIGEIMNIYLAYQIADEIADRINSALAYRADERKDD